MGRMFGKVEEVVYVELVFQLPVWADKQTDQRHNSPRQPSQPPRRRSQIPTTAITSPVSTALQCDPTLDIS